MNKLPIRHVESRHCIGWCVCLQAMCYRNSLHRLGSVLAHHVCKLRAGFLLFHPSIELLHPMRKGDVQRCTGGHIVGNMHVVCRGLVQFTAWSVCVHFVSARLLHGHPRKRGGFARKWLQTLHNWNVFYTLCWGLRVFDVQQQQIMYSGWGTGATVH